jgi:hypothetical protein
MSTFETDGTQRLSYLGELWQKLDNHIWQTHRNLEKLIETKIRIEQELSSNEQTTGNDQQQVTAQEIEHFQEVRKEGTRNFFEDSPDKVPLRLLGIYQGLREMAHE